jgi:hypothetical protein
VDVVLRRDPVGLECPAVRRPRLLDLGFGFGFDLGFDLGSELRLGGCTARFLGPGVRRRHRGTGSGASARHLYVGHARPLGSGLQRPVGEHGVDDGFRRGDGFRRDRGLRLDRVSVIAHGVGLAHGVGFDHGCGHARGLGLVGSLDRVPVTAVVSGLRRAVVFFGLDRRARTVRGGRSGHSGG